MTLKCRVGCRTLITSSVQQQQALNLKLEHLATVETMAPVSRINQLYYVTLETIYSGLSKSNFTDH